MNLPKPIPRLGYGPLPLDLQSYQHEQRLCVWLRHSVNDAPIRNKRPSHRHGPHFQEADTWPEWEEGWHDLFFLQSRGILCLGKYRMTANQNPDVWCPSSSVILNRKSNNNILGQFYDYSTVTPLPPRQPLPSCRISGKQFSKVLTTSLSLSKVNLKKKVVTCQ